MNPWATLVPNRGSLTNHVLAIQTAVRPAENTLRSTMLSLEQAGSEVVTDRIIVADGYTPVAHGWDLVVSPKGGSAKTFFRLLKEVLARWPRVEYVTFCEDDIVLSKNALRYIVTTAFPRGVSLIAWFSPYELRSPAPELKCFYGDIFYYSQAVTFTRTLLTQMVVKERGWSHADGPDLIMRSCGPRWAVHCPNLVDHVGGENSACGYSWLGERRSVSFLGQEYDCNLL